MAALIFTLNRDYLTQAYVEQFHELAYSFGVDDLVLVSRICGPIRGIRNYAGQRFVVVPDWETALEVLEHPAADRFVFLEDNGTDLPGVTYPERPVFVLGDDKAGLPVNPTGENIVARIPVLKPRNLWSQQAAAIVLSDWYSKAG